MDVSKMGLNEIMQLPDEAFGRRWIVSVAQVQASTVLAWDISEGTLPERFVLWELVMYMGAIEYQAVDFRLALGDQLPTAAAQMDLLQALIPGLGLDGPDPRYNRIIQGRGMSVRNLRMPIRASGRRLIMESQAIVVVPNHTQAAIVVSSIPREVPEWLISGQA